MKWTSCYGTQSRAARNRRNVNDKTTSQVCMWRRNNKKNKGQIIELIFLLLITAWVGPCCLCQHPTSPALLTSPTHCQRELVCGACIGTTQVGDSLVTPWARGGEGVSAPSCCAPHGHDQTPGVFHLFSFFRLAAVASWHFCNLRR